MAKRTTRKKETFTRWDSADHLKTEKDMALYLEACFEEGGEDSAFIAAALGDVARARGMMKLAETTGITRAGLYRALTKQSNPSFATVLKVIHALGLNLSVKVA